MICPSPKPVPVYWAEREDTCDSSLSVEPKAADVISFT